MQSGGTWTANKHMHHGRQSCGRGATVYDNIGDGAHGRGSVWKADTAPDSNFRIAVLIPWIEQRCLEATCDRTQLLPPFFRAWVASAQANADVADFLIFLEESASSLFQSIRAAPGNIRLITVANITALYASRLGLDVHFPISTHKIKDVRAQPPSLLPGTTCPSRAGSSSLVLGTSLRST